MNKKIISIFFLLIIFASIALAYNYFSQESTEETQYDSTDKNVNDSDVADEIDDSFVEEDDEVEIGEMV
jgi:type II secretory pathway component PulC